jgi:CRP-like cAMP-binding protein
MPTSNDLQRFECFHHHSEAALTAVAAVMRPRTLLAGEPLFRQGESDGGSCFLLYSGCVAVHRKSAEQTRKLATVEPPSTLAEPPENGSMLQAGDVRGAEEGGMPREIQDVADANTGLSRVERIGRDRVYVGMYVQKKYVRVHAPEDHGEFLYRRTPGTVVGALSALTGCKRYETAVAEIDCTVFEVRREDYNTWLATKDEKAHASDCLFLRETPCFCLLPDSVLVKIAASFQRSSYSSKVDICNQGTTAIAMYVIRSGECELTRRVKRAAGHDNLHLVNLGRTDLVGHHELLSNKLHSFTVSTIGNVELWALSSETLHALFDSHVTHTHLHLDTRLIGSGGQLINGNDHVSLEQSPIDRSVRRNAIYSHSGLGVSDGVWKRLKQDLVEHGKRAHAFHKQRAYHAGVARYDPKEQERLAEMSVRKEEQTPQWQAAEAARARERQEKERRAGNLCSSIEQGPALVGQVLNQKVYTRVVKLKPRIHKLLRQPLETTAKSLPHILRKRQQMFQAPEKADLTSGVDSTPEWMEHIDFPEPFRLSDKNLSQREHLIHDKLNYAVNMFDTYASLAMKRIRRLAPKTSKTDARASTTRTARTARTATTANSPPSIRSLESSIRKATRSPSPTRLPTTHTAKSGRSRSSIGATSALWIDLEGFLSVLEGADLVDRNMRQNVNFEHEWEAFGRSPELSPPFGKDEQTDWRSPELSPPFGKETAASPLSPKVRLHACSICTPTPTPKHMQSHTNTCCPSPPALDPGLAHPSRPRARHRRHQPLSETRLSR